jgi:hypothetical protein
MYIILASGDSAIEEPLIAVAPITVPERNGVAEPFLIP